jgi:molecular chaperone DnaK
VPQIEVTFDIDANGILHVSAKDLGTGKEQKITITASSGLSKEEVDRMKKDAELHEDEDRKRRDEIETRNEVDSAVYRSEKMLKDNADKIQDADKAKIESAIAASKEAIKGSDATAIKSATERLNESWQSVSESLYKAAADQHGKGAAGSAAGGSEGTGTGRTSTGVQDNNPDASGSDDGPIIDAEVVDEKKD